MTSRALLFTRAILGTRAMTVFAGYVLAYFELLGDALADFFQRKPNLQAQVAAAILLRAACPASETTEAVTTKDVTEHREDVVHIH